MGCAAGYHEGDYFKVPGTCMGRSWNFLASHGNFLGTSLGRLCIVGEATRHLGDPNFLLPPTISGNTQLSIQLKIPTLTLLVLDVLVVGETTRVIY